MSELSPPTLELLDIELNEITEWERLGVHINLGWKYEQVLRKVGHLGIDRCKLELFRIWITTGTNVTWRAIADALGKMDENTLAEKIRNKYEPVIDEPGNRTQPTVSVSERIQKDFDKLQFKFFKLLSQLKKALLRSGKTIYGTKKSYDYDTEDISVAFSNATNLDLDIADNNDMTPLMISVGSNKVALAHQLLESGANPNIAKKDGDTALHIACYYGHVKMVRQLLKFNADPCALKADGWTPLMVAIPSNHVKVIEILLKQGKVDPNMQNKNDGDNPLLIASWNNCTDIVQVLLSNGADPNITKHDGWTPLIAASLLGHLSIVEALFQKGAFINTQAKDGVTPIYVASQDGHAMVVRFLLEKGADFYLTKTDSETSITTSPLVIACQNGHSNVVELLLEKDIEQINTRNPESGATPLFIASYHGQAAVVKLLLMRGANPSIKDKNKQTPIDVTKDNLCKEILREAGAIETKQALPQRIISNAKNFTTRLVGNLRRRFIGSSN
uniref:Uncharacterized protein n=2 Tax=Amphimedon queenslandica TaxID=400682 RepID=A0A1X7UL13_AMPQE